MDAITSCDAVILAVAHTQFSKFTLNQIDDMFGKGQKVLVDERYSG